MKTVTSIHIRTTLIHQLSPQVDHEHKSTAKINESVLWESIGCVGSTIKNIMYFIITFVSCVLCIVCYNKLYRLLTIYQHTTE